MFNKKCIHECVYDNLGLWSNINSLRERIKILETENRVQMEFLESLANQLGYKLHTMSHSGKTVVIKQ